MTTEIASDYSELTSTDIFIQIHLEMTGDHSYLIYKTGGGGAGGGVSPIIAYTGRQSAQKGYPFQASGI